MTPTGSHSSNPVRLLDFLVAVLAAHAHTLNRLAALFSEEMLVEVLERAGEAADDRAMAARDAGTAETPDPTARLNLRWNPSTSQLAASAYQELETAISDFRVSKILEFHLWAYPYYRQWIQSPTDLAETLDLESDPSAINRLAEDAMLDAQAWVRALPISPDFGRRAELASQAAWVRFRTDLLRKAGLRPIASAQ